MVQDRAGCFPVRIKKFIKQKSISAMGPILVVSIDLFWVSFMPFLYNGVYLWPGKVSYHIPLPHPHFLPPSHFERPNYSFVYSNVMFLHDSHSHLQTIIFSLMPLIVWKDQLTMYLPKSAKEDVIMLRERREQVKFVAPPKEMLLSFSTLLRSAGSTLVTLSKPLTPNP